MDEAPGILSLVLESNVQIQVGLRILLAACELVVLGLAVWSIQRLFRLRSSRFLAWVWALVLVKPLLTIAIGTPLVLAEFEITPPDLLPAAQGRSDQGEFRHFQSGNSAQPRSVWTITMLRAGRSDRSQRVLGTVILRHGAWLRALGTIWIVGILLGGIRWGLAGYRLRLIVGRSQDPGERLLEIYDAETAARGIRKVPRLCVSPEVESPVLFGAFKPVILVPAWLVDSDRGKLRHLFAHELMHHIHRDSFVLAIGQLALLLFFFHPVAYWAFREWLFQAELSCDRALIESEDEARDYARELIEVMEGMKKRKGALSGLYATRHQLLSRMDALLEIPLVALPRITVPQRMVVLVFAILLGLYGLRVDIKPLDHQAFDTLFIGSTGGEDLLIGMGSLFGTDSDEANQKNEELGLTIE